VIVHQKVHVPFLPQLLRINAFYCNRKKVQGLKTITPLY